MMNERIKELLTPKLKEWGGATGDNFSEELEKFATLIIKECSNHIRDAAMRAGGANTIVGEEGLWLADDLVKNFGVE